MNNPTSIELLLRYRDKGDEQACAEFLQRHLDRLIEQVRWHMSAKLARRIGPEDVVQLGCRSFFVRIRNGRIDLEGGDDPKKLLAEIVLRKFFRQIEFHQGAAKRSIDREESAAGEGSSEYSPTEPRDPEPTPEELAQFREEYELLLQGFQPNHQTMIELKLQGYKITEIARRTGRTTRTVSDVIRCFRDRLQRRLDQLDE